MEAFSVSSATQTIRRSCWDAAEFYGRVADNSTYSEKMWFPTDTAPHRSPIYLGHLLDESISSHMESHKPTQTSRTLGFQPNRTSRYLAAFRTNSNTPNAWLTSDNDEVVSSILTSPTTWKLGSSDFSGVSSFMGSRSSLRLAS